jgi:hemolysin-activating ACP:hemolysin acyltransferase
MNVAKKGHPDKIEFVQTPAMLAGNEIDDALTKRISQGSPLPDKFAPYEGVAQAVLSAPGTKLTQVKLALDQSFKPCGYMDWDTAWVRSIYDVAVINGEHAWFGDWKNGQIWLDSDQLKLFAAVGFHQFPELQVIDTSYVWLKHGITSDETYRRRELPEIWNDLLPDVERMQVSFRNNHWEPTPSKRSCKWCAVNKVGKCPVPAVPFGG